MGSYEHGLCEIIATYTVLQQEMPVITKEPTVLLKKLASELVAKLLKVRFVIHF